MGDTIEILSRLPENSVDLVFADPPYGLSKAKGLSWAFSKHVTLQESWDMFTQDDLYKFNLQWISEALRVLRPGGSFWACGSFHNIYQIGFIMQSLGMRINNSIIWFKPNAQPNITTRMFTESTEQLIWGVKNHSSIKWTFNYKDMKEMNGGKQMRNMWTIPVTPRKEKLAGDHPTQKPIELLKRVILSSSMEGDTVLDPFLGSGTTSLVAEMVGRNSVGIEISPEYMDIIRKRMDGIRDERKDEELTVEFI